MGGDTKPKILQLLHGLVHSRLIPISQKRLPILHLPALRPPGTVRGPDLVDWTLDPRALSQNLASAARLRMRVGIVSCPQFRVERREFPEFEVQRHDDVCLQ